MNQPNDQPKTLVVALDNVPRYQLDAIVCTLPGRAAKLWAWLRGNAHGWRFDVEQIAEKCRCSVRTVWRAAADLAGAKLLELGGDVWRVTAPASVTSGTSKKPRDHAPARSLSEKEKPTYSEKRSNVVGEPGGREVGVSDSDKRTDTPTPPDEHPPQEPPEPVKARPTHAPDNHDRPPAPCADRMRIEAFLRAWTAEFRVGPSALNLMVLPSAWQQRILWLWQYWTADELREAFIATRDAVPRNAWKYFCACLERIAAGHWDDANPHDYGVAPGATESGPRVAEELLDEVRAEQRRDVDDMPALVREVAVERGFDPDDLTTEERSSCIVEVLRRRTAAMEGDR